jgi:DNA-binding MarR family transcriptional regulator
VTSDAPTFTPSGYWYGDDARTTRGVAVLTAMREYRAAESAMRKRTRTSMGMGETDLLALQLLLQAKRAGRTMSPKDLAQALGISSASTTILIDRLVKSGHAERRAHPSDRRALIVAPTDATESEVRHTLGGMHHRMIEAAEALDADDAAAIVGFLRSMRTALDAVE